MQDIEELAKRRGFFWKSSEIYGGLSGFYDYGHLGKLLKNKWEAAWRATFLRSDNFYEIETAQIVPEAVLVASGHVTSFVDPVVRCSKCGTVERADHLVEAELKESFEGMTPQQLDELIAKHHIRCRKCKGTFEETGIMNMMFSLSAGTGKDAQKAYLLPETAQGAYLNFNRCFEHLRKQLPLGLAIIGRAYRNEISPRNALLRMREFRQAELQIFFDPDTIDKHEGFDSIAGDELLLLPHGSQHVRTISCAAAVRDLKLPRLYVYCLRQMQRFFLDVMHVNPASFRFRELSAEEKAFYNKYHWDAELKLSLGWKEVAGCHYRTDHDLQGHQRVSKQNFEVLDERTGQRFIPHVLELSFGVDRNVYALLDLNYDDNKERGNIVLHLPGTLTPYFCAVFPLVKNKPEVAAKAEQVYTLLKSSFSSLYDETASVGRRYARADEQGVRYCLTVDFESLADDAVTIRDRETTQQERVKISRLKERLGELYSTR